MKSDVYSVSSSVAGSQSPIYSGATSADTSCADKRKSRVQCLYFLIVILLLAVIGLIIAVIVVKTDASADDSSDTAKVKGDKQPGTCETSECALAAARVISYMDQTADPCEDFYQYACGSWRKTKLIPDDKSRYTLFSQIDDKIKIIKKYLIEDEKSYPNFRAVNLAKDLFKSCMNTELIDQLDDSVAVRVLEELGGWPVLGSKPGGNWNESNFDLTDLLVKINLDDVTPLIGLIIYTDLRQSDTRILYLDQARLLLPSRNYYLQPELAHMRAAELTLMIELAVAMGADRDNATEEMKKVQELHIDLANISMAAEDRRDDNVLYNKFTIGQLKEIFPEPNATDSIQFSWSDFLLGFFNAVNVENITVDNNESIIVYSMPYMEKLMGVIQKYDKRTIANHILLFPINNYAASMSTRFIDINRQYRKVLFGSSVQPARWKTCLTTATSYFPMAVSYLFLKETFQADAKQEALLLIDGIQEVFRTILTDVPWMDEETKMKAMDKAKYIRNKIGYPDQVLNETYVNDLYKDYDINKDEFLWNKIRNLRMKVKELVALFRKPVDKDEWIDDMSEVNAYYSASSNSMYFPAGIFQPPFFVKGQPKAMNFGGIGMVIGHELTHGFDDWGRQYDKDGNLAQWWSEDIVEKFKNKTTCMIDQYGQYVVPEANITLNGINTLGENIADNGGLKEAYMAYRKWVQRRGREEDRLPGLNLNNDQLFFVSNAQIWCENIREQFAVYAVNNGVHPVHRYRVIGPFQNSPDFARVFKCGNNTYMNPPNKCSVW